MTRFLVSLICTLSALTLVAQEAPDPSKKNVDVPKHEGEDPKDKDDGPKTPEIDPNLEVVTPTIPPFGDASIQNALKKIHERQSQPLCMKAGIAIKRSNPLLKQPSKSSAGTLHVKRTANGHMRVLWEEPGSRVIVMNDTSTYVKWEGSKDAFEFPHRKREKYFATFPLHFGVTKPFLDQFDFDSFAIPTLTDVDKTPKNVSPALEPRNEDDPNPAKRPPSREIREVAPPEGVVDPPIRATSAMNPTEMDYPTSKDEYIFRLIPKIGAKPGEAPYSASLNNTTIWINVDTLTVTRIVLIETNGERTEIAINKAEAVADIPEITFTRPLDGVRIIEAK